MQGVWSCRARTVCTVLLWLLWKWFRGIDIQWSTVWRSWWSHTILSRPSAWDAFLPLLMVWFQFVLEVEQLFFIALRVTVHSFYHLGVHAPLVLIDTFNERVGVPVHKCTTAACFALRCLEIVTFNALWVNLLNYWLKGLLVGFEANALTKLRRVVLFRHLLRFDAEFDFMAQLVILEVGNAIDLHTFWLFDALFYLHVVNIFS